ncbi:CPBP family intramembrane metalloprotease [Virgibacillus sp. MSJ-26]|uniref:CPBP family intramembrane glutamic endopeptidase n=1 Tax=Virgibacillus sp. MSJ-26 TaxID=2841522 RepID=UPI001C10D565|nr:CPBP family intramembrane glutamic endopeptidase [Virgibacillus sp. MSJ-26]MBU5468458.1 CPBP family intramembrane metalloprotease [Virgibacillus sp. MSJ-26]
MKKTLVIFIASTLFLTSGLAFLALELDQFSPFLMIVPLITSFLVQKLVLRRPIFGKNGLGFQLGKKRYLFLAPLFSFLFIIIVYSISFMFNPNLFSIEQAYMSIQQDLLTFNEEFSLLTNIFIAGALQLLIAPFLNIFIFIGEEVGWRGFLYPYLISVYGKKGLIYGGLIWGIWHTPMIYLYDLNFGPHHHLGLIFMIIFCILSGIILQFIYYKSRSIYSVALMHGVLNISGSFIFIFSVKSEYRYFVDGATGMIGITILLFLAYMCYRRFPVQEG